MATLGRDITAGPKGLNSGYMERKMTKYEISREYHLDKLALLLRECDAALGMLSSMPPVLAIREKISEALKNRAVLGQEHCSCIACRDGITHDSDCSVHNMPAYENGPCDCPAQRWL